MPTRGLIGSLLVGFWIAFSLVDCSSFSRVAFTRAEQDVAAIPGIPDARVWADDPTGLSRTAPFSDGQRKPSSQLTCSHCQVVAPKAHSGLAC